MLLHGGCPEPQPSGSTAGGFWSAVAYNLDTVARVSVRGASDALCRRASSWGPGGKPEVCLCSTKVEQVHAHLGTASLLGVGGSPVKLGLRRVALHPRYNPGILDFDVALLELVQPLVFNKYIQPVCLPLAIHKFPVGRKCMISGWGNMQEGNGEQVPEGMRKYLRGLAWEGCSMASLTGA